MEKLLARQGEIQEKIEAGDGWNLDSRLDLAMEALRERDVQQQTREAELWIPPGPRLRNLVVETSGLSKSYDGKLIFENLDITIPPGAIVGVVGANGAGKTTLFRLIAGVEQPDAGQAVMERP